MFPKNSLDSQNKKKSKEPNSVVIYLCNVYDDACLDRANILYRESERQISCFGEKNRLAPSIYTLH